MLSRHFLRTKVLQAIYAVQVDPADMAVVEKNFKHNIYRLNDLGIAQISALVHLVEVAEVMVEEAQHKFMPTDSERNPNMRLINNRFIRRMADNFDYRRHCDNANINWGGVEFDEVFRKAYLGLTKLGIYTEYLSSDDNFAEDQKFALKIFKYLMNDSLFCDSLYRQSLLWEDDFDQIAQYNFMMLKALDESFDESTVIALMHDIRNPKDTEAYEFARQLLLNTMRHRSESEELVRKYLKGWDYERVAGMDLLLLNMALAELINCPSIPERVTVDEYVELSKEFSTERSRLFINGILDKLILELRSDGRIKKSGRGLMIGDETASYIVDTETEDK